MRGGFVLGRAASRSVSFRPSRRNSNRIANRTDPAASCCTPRRCPGGRLGREAYRFVDWLAEAGQSWWAMLPLGAARLDRLAVRVAVGLRRPRRLPRAAARARHARRARGVRRPPALLDRRLGSLRGHRRRRRPGALRARVERAARYAADRGVRLFGDVPIYVAHGRRRLEAHPELFQDGRRRRRAARRAERDRPALGQPALRLARDAGARATAGGSSGSGARSSSRRRPHRPLPRLRRVLGRPGAPQDRASTAGGGPGPGAELFRAAERELGPLPLVAEDLGVITPPVERLRDELGIPGMVVMQFAFDGPPIEPAPAREPPPAERRLRRARTTTTPLLGWWRTLPARVRAGDRASRGSSRTGS